MATAAKLPQLEHASRAEIAAWQLERLRWTLGRAYDNVPYLRAKFDAAGVRPEQLETLADLARFPFTSKHDLRETYPYGLFASPMRDIVRLHASSGTTGKPTVVGYTQPDIDMWADLIARCLRHAGVTADDIVHVAHGYGLFTGGLGVHYGAERLGCTVVPMSGGQTERQVQLIRDFQPTVIIVTPSYALNLADEFERQGFDPAESSLKLGLFGAEPWGEEMRRELESRFGIKAMDLYGLSEVIGPGVASECLATQDGPVLWEDRFYAEIIDPETGEVLPDDAEGELVFTSLTKEAMPIVRYRTRDLTRLLPPTALAFRRLGKITGRSDDMLIIRGVNVFPSQIEELILRETKLAPQFEIHVSREGHLDRMAILVELRPEFALADATEREAAARSLQHRIKSLIGITTHLRVVDPGTLARAEGGKAKRVVDSRPKVI